MSVREIYRDSSTKTVFVSSKFDIRKNITKFYRQAGVVVFLMFITALISPVLWIALASYLLMRHQKIWNLYFNDLVFPSTVKQFTKHGADKSAEAFSIFGYEVDSDEWENHKRKLSGFQLPKEVNDYGKLYEFFSKKEHESNVNELMLTAKNIKKNKPYKEFGLGLDTMFRHIMFSGTTGAGKTETLMSLFTDAMKAGGGVIFIDAKADMKMMQTFYRLAKDLGRETSFKVINLLKSELQPETNTYNPVLTLPPVKAIDFAASLLPGGDGNADYFKNRGITMMSPVMVTAKLRDVYYGETTSLTVLQDMVKPVNITIYFAMAYCAVLEMNKRLEQQIENDIEVRDFYNKIKGLTVAVENEMMVYEHFLNYVLQHSPQSKRKIEGISGVPFNFFNETYRKSFFALKSYMNGVYPSWFEMSNALARFLYAYWKNRNRNFLFDELDPVRVEEFRKAFEEMESDTKVIEAMAETDPDYLGPQLSNVLKALNHPVGGKPPKESIKTMPETPLQQHLYAQQQWDKLFNALDQFPNVFGSSKPDVVMKDIIKNNGLLYVLLPPLELGPDTVKLIGNMFVRDIQIAAAEALGGHTLDLEKEQVNILADRITPKPINIVTFDEWGAVKVPGMSIVLSQVRSIKICAILSGQDFVSFKPDGGEGEAEQKRLLANSAKLILKTYDNESMKWAEEFIGKRYYYNPKKYLDEKGDLTQDVYGEIEEKEEAIMDVKKLSDMMYGCGVFISGSMPTIVQSYYVGGKPEGSFITNFESL